ncbi:TRAF-type zinc finger protein [Streptomyces laurentii]|uniref:TRAF-type zinc finger protein n=1 Tax=Streptomyces laurentii TaxID=39478 RepID=A0A160P9L3_STRLU|nr:TRAF-type zinc finger protein [Streptomyces laurentii]
MDKSSGSSSDGVDLRDLLHYAAPPQAHSGSRSADGQDSGAPGGSAGTGSEGDRQDWEHGVPSAPMPPAEGASSAGDGAGRPGTQAGL